ncbi:MAG: AraC family transcriptional regulator [Spirochaetota bacterium]
MMKRPHAEPRLHIELSAGGLHIHRSASASVAVHRHDFLELMLVEKSGGRHWINDRSVPLTKGDVYFIGSYHAHAITGGRRSSYRIIAFHPDCIAVGGQLSPLYALFCDPRRAPHVHLSANRFRHVCALIDFIESSAQEQEAASARALEALLLYIAPARTETTGPIPLTVLRHIDEHFRSDVRSDALASSLGISPSRLAQIMHTETGTSIKDLLLRRRIAEAKRFLLTTNGTIGEVMRGSGFNDASYFQRTFRRLTDTTPQEFRRTHAHTGMQSRP